MTMKLKIVEAAGAPKAVGPYSQAVRAGGFIFCSGQIALDPKTGQMAEGLNAAGQARLAMRNLSAVLAAEGCRLEDIVKATIYLADIADFAAVNDAYAAALGVHRPARATVEVSRLPKGALVEIEAIAWTGN